LEKVLGRIPLLKGEGGAKHRVRGTKKNVFTPHPALRATLSPQERDPQDQELEFWEFAETRKGDIPMESSSLLSSKRTAVVVFVVAILAVGLTRFSLTMLGVEDRITTFFSISVVIGVGVFYFGLSCERWRDRMTAAYVLFIPYTLIAVAALGYTWITGQPTIFQRHELSMTGLTIGQHFTVMLIGGFSLEPWAAFAVMSLIAWIAWMVRRVFVGGISRQRRRISRLIADLSSSPSAPL
jgi:hypothetical protein